MKIGKKQQIAPFEFLFEVEVTESYLHGGFKRYIEWVSYNALNLNEATDKLFIKYIKKSTWDKHYGARILSTSIPN